MRWLHSGDCGCQPGQKDGATGADMCSAAAPGHALNGLACRRLAPATVPGSTPPPLARHAACKAVASARDNTGNPEAPGTPGASYCDGPGLWNDMARAQEAPLASLGSEGLEQ
mmetsp:Transcript_29179/g.62033  ORF Transcript_29179/g.62033 Transcript_29179/m.62033 type:complete len:113 (+) Transcript_29179:1539-1877(+)